MKKTAHLIFAASLLLGACGSGNDSNGSSSGSDNRGCKYNGSVSVPDSSRNDYEVGNFTSSCLSGSAFSGVGSFSAASGLSKAVFRIAVDNGNGGVFLKLTAV